jgi:hypothetical protein
MSLIGQEERHPCLLCLKFLKNMLFNYLLLAAALTSTVWSGSLDLSIKENSLKTENCPEGTSVKISKGIKMIANIKKSSFSLKFGESGLTAIPAQGSSGNSSKCEPLFQVEVSAGFQLAIAKVKVSGKLLAPKPPLYLIFGMLFS